MVLAASRGRLPAGPGSRCAGVLCSYCIVLRSFLCTKLRLYIMLHILYRATLRGTDASVRRVQAPVQQVVQTQLVTRDKQEETKTSGGKRRIMPKLSSYAHVSPISCYAAKPKLCRSAYAAPGTDAAYDATRSFATRPQTPMRPPLSPKAQYLRATIVLVRGPQGPWRPQRPTRYAVPGTDIADRTTRSPVLGAQACAVPGTDILYGVLLPAASFSTALTAGGGGAGGGGSGHPPAQPAPEVLAAMG
eukprot:552503-Rhodomonas_salina.2